MYLQDAGKVLCVMKKCARILRLLRNTYCGGLEIIYLRNYRSYCLRGRRHWNQSTVLSRPPRTSCGRTSDNYGIEQERLNNVFGANLRITALRASKARLELLEYLTPHSGQSIPADTQSNDLWNWQIQLSTHDTRLLTAFCSAVITVLFPICGRIAGW